MVVKKKADISLVLRVRTKGEIITKNMEKQQEDNSEGDTAIWRIFAELDKLNVHYRR